MCDMTAETMIQVPIDSIRNHGCAEGVSKYTVYKSPLYEYYSKGYDYLLPRPAVYANTLHLADRVRTYCGITRDTDLYHGAVKYRYDSIEHMVLSENISPCKQCFHYHEKIDELEYERRVKYRIKQMVDREIAAVEKACLDLARESYRIVSTSEIYERAKKLYQDRHFRPHGLSRRLVDIRNEFTRVWPRKKATKIENSQKHWVLELKNG